jgi:chromosome partitioning protein
MKVISVCNSKGGVGKSTLAAALAVRASKELRVGLVDIDPQQSLAEWFAQRPVKNAPEVYTGELDPQAVVEKLKYSGLDLVIIDGPPAYLDMVEEAIRAADLVLIPVKPSIPDLRSTRDAIQLAISAAKPYLVVINDATKRDGTTDTTIALLGRDRIPVATTIMHHRVSHMHAMGAGKSAAEINGGRDKDAAEEIEALWTEVAHKLASLKVPA